MSVLRRRMMGPKRDYIASGLNIHFDGILNTRNGHDPSTKTWENLVDSGNDLISRSSAPTVGDDFMIYPYGGYVRWEINGGESRTIEIVADAEGVNRRAILCESDNYGSDRFIQTDETSYHNNGFYFNYYDSWDLNTHIPGNGKMQSINEHKGKVSMSASAGTLNTTLYIDGEVNNRLLVLNRLMIATRYFIGCNRQGFIPFGRKIHSVRIYNRALTADEVAHNYAIDKERFHL